MAPSGTDSIPFLISAARRILANNKCDSHVEGHVSHRTERGDTFLVTPWQYSHETVPSDLIEVDFHKRRTDGKPLGFGPGNASTATAFHGAIYEARPDVNVVIHTHGVWLPIFATLNKTTGLYNHEVVIIDGDQVVYEDSTDPTNEGHRVSAALGDDKHILIMKNHGAIIAGATMEEAVVKTLILERNCRFEVLGRMIDGQEFPRALVGELQEPYRQQVVPQVWAGELRKLRRTDPDLFEIVGAEKHLLAV